MPELTLGRIVHYTVSDHDLNNLTPGLSVQTGNHNAVRAGSVYPAMVVGVNSENSANLQVFIDGDASFWATSRSEGDTPGTWAWPVRNG